MKNLLLCCASFLYLALPFNANTQEKGRIATTENTTISAQVSPLASVDAFAGNFGFDLLKYETPALPEVRTPAPVYSKGDFTAIPDYAFAYLNELTVKLMDASQSNIDIVMFSITLKDMPEAIMRAKDRGVKIRMIIDEKHIYPRMDTQIKRLIAYGGIDIRSLRGTRDWGVNHNKIGIFDRSVATTGSYNWTFGATFSNYENMIVAKHPLYVTGYMRYFEWMWSKSRTLEQGPSQTLPEGYYGVPPQDDKPIMALNGMPVPAYLFSPGSSSENRLAAIIGAARRSVDVVTFTFSSKPLADALIAAHQRGVKVRFMMDQNMGKESVMAKYVFDNGVEFRWRRGRTDKGALHNKFAILDGQILETGSFNWTTNASVNSFENIIFISDPKALASYQSKYNWLYSQALTPVAADFQPEDPFAEETPAPAVD